MRPTVVVGTDLVKIAEVAAAVGRFGDRYLQRLYTTDEIRDCVSDNPSTTANRLAARFAAKEATCKAMRIGDDAIDLRGIEVQRREGGWCDIVLHGEAASLADRAGVTAFSLSMSHEGDYATAVVIAQLAAPVAHLSGS